MVDPATVQRAVNHFLDEYARGNGTEILALSASRVVSNLQSAQVVEIPSLQEVEEDIQSGKDDRTSTFYFTPRKFQGEVNVDKNSCKHVILLTPVIDSLKKQQTKVRLDIAKFKDIIKTLEGQEKRLKSLSISIQRKSGNQVSVPLSRFLSDDRGPFEGATETTHPNRKRGRPKKKKKKQTNGRD